MFSSLPVIVICEGLGGTGAVANVAWQQVLRLSRQQSVCLISDGLSYERQQQLSTTQLCLRLRILTPPQLKVLRRFAHLPRQLAWILLALRAAQQELQGTRAAVICHSHPLAAAVAWRFGRRIRLIMVSHGDIFYRPPGSYDPSIAWLYRRTTAYAHRRAAVSVALSPVMLKRIQAHGVPPERVALVPNGIDPDEIGLNNPMPTTLGHWKEWPLRLLFVGRLDPVKGVDVLLESMALAKEAGLELQLDIVGTGSISEQHRLQALSVQLSIFKNVHWHGNQPRSSLASFYRRSHVVVVPSLDDPLPTVVLESMASGRPVVGSAVGGIGYLVRDGVSGILVPPSQPHALADVFASLDQDRLGTSALGQAALERSSNFSWAANVEAIKALITETDR